MAQGEFDLREAFPSGCPLRSSAHSIKFDFYRSFVQCLRQFDRAQAKSADRRSGAREPHGGGRVIQWAGSGVSAVLAFQQDHSHPARYPAAAR